MSRIVKIIVGLFVSLIIAIILIISLPKNGLMVSYLNIGQGDGIYIRTPDDYHILIDAGPTSKILEELGEIMPLYNRTIDLILISHPHADHLNGFVEIVKRYKVNRVLMVGTPSRNQFYQKLLNLFNEKEIPVHFAVSDNDIKLGKDVYMDVIWPMKIEAGSYYENVNNASLAVKITFGNDSFLFTGDAEIEQEEEMLDSGFDLVADILKAGHHGSKTASSEDFLDSVVPEKVVIQSGAGNSYGHPHKETLLKYFERNIEILRNDLQGRITLEFSL